MNIDRETTPEACILHISGDVDMATVETFRSVLRDATRSAQPTVSLDLRQVGFIGSLGVSAILDHAQRLRRQGRRLTIADSSPTAARIFGLLHCEDLLPRLR